MAVVSRAGRFIAAVAIAAAAAVSFAAPLTPTAAVPDLARPQCTVRDDGDTNYASGWSFRNLTYSVNLASLPAYIGPADMLMLVHRAFDLWRQQVQLEFWYVANGAGRRNRANIVISFERGDHGDSSPFTGTSQLGHGFFPETGLVHLNYDTPWFVFDSHNPPDRYPGSDRVHLYHTIVHEIGHALGLTHARSTTAVMGVFYPGFIFDIRLEPEDVNGIRQLYSARENPPRHQYNTVVPDEQAYNGLMRTRRRKLRSKALCSLGRADALLTIGTDRNRAYAFVGPLCYLVERNRGLVNKQWPRKTASLWPGAPAQIDAAFYHPGSARTYFFSRGYVWRYSNFTLDANYPYRMGQRFPTVPENPTAVSVSPFNENRIWFFGGGNGIWEYDPRRTALQRIGLPLAGSIWTALPMPRNEMLVFIDRWYYVLEPEAVAAGPLSVADHWFGCA